MSDEIVSEGGSSELLPDESSVDPSKKPLTRREQLFVAKLLIFGSPGRAVIECGWYRGTNPKRKGEKLCRRPHIRAAIDKARAEQAERLKLTADMVVELIRDQAEADPNELIEYRRECCRYCWGIDNRYQYTPAELERARTAHLDKQKHDTKLGDFDEQGGRGFNPKLVPNPKCPECHGDGEGREFIHDTRFLSNAARALYAGVKVTEKGIEVKTNSQDKAREMLAKHAGVVRERLEHTGKDGAPLAPPIINIGFDNGGPGEPIARPKGP